MRGVPDPVGLVPLATKPCSSTGRVGHGEQRRRQAANRSGGATRGEQGPSGLVFGIFKTTCVKPSMAAVGEDIKITQYNSNLNYKVF